MLLRPVLLGILLLPALVLAKAPAPRRQALADLDGDGKAESLRLEVKDTTFVLSAGGARAEGHFEGPVQGLSVVDLAANEPHREVLIHGQAAGGALAYRLFRLEGGALQELALPPGKPVISGNGILLADVPMGFWERRDKYLYDAAKPGFTEVPQPLYFVGKGFVPEQPLKLRVSREGDALVTEVAAKTPVVLLAFSPAPEAAREDDSQGWYLVLTRQHLLGWVKREALGASPRAEKKPDFPFIKEEPGYERPKLERLDARFTQDFNGDGKPETLTVTTLPEPDREPLPYESDAPSCLRDANAFEITVGSVSLTDASDGCVPVVAAGIVDLDTRDRSKEVLVYATGGGAEPNQVFLYRWVGKRILLIESAEEMSSYPGNGTMVGSTGWYLGRKVYDPGKSALIEFPQEWTYTGWNYTVKKSFPLRYAPASEASVVANVRADSTVTLVARAENKTPQSTHWVLFKSETGLMGWVNTDDVRVEPSF
jgi:hypothetical protein